MNVVHPSLSILTLLSIHCGDYVTRLLLLLLLVCCRPQRTGTLCHTRLFWEVPRPVRLASQFIVVATMLLCLQASPVMSQLIIVVDADVMSYVQ